MLACAQETDGGVKDVFAACGLSAPILRATLGGAKLGEDNKDSRPLGSPPKRGGKEDLADPIEAFCRDLTRLAAQGKFDPIHIRRGHHLAWNVRDLDPVKRALEAKGIAVEVHRFAGEGHGFRSGAVRIAVLEATEAFFRRHFQLGALL